MRSTVLILAAASLPLLGCPADEEDPPDTSTTTEHEHDSDHDHDTEHDTEHDHDSGGSTTDGGTTTDNGGSTTTDDGGSTTTGEALGCPYEDPGWQNYEQGIQIPHWELETHTGEIWRACDHYASPMVIDTSAMWCGPCQALAAFMAGNDEAAFGIFNDEQFVNDYVYPFRDYVNAGCISWVTVLTQNEQGTPPSTFDAQTWDTQYPNENIPVVADATGNFENYLNITAYPTTFLVNNDFTYLTDDLVYGLQLVVDNLECDTSGLE